MVLECANSAFGSVGTVFFWGNTLKLDLIFEEGVLEVLGAFIVQDVQIGRMTLMYQDAVCLFPGIANAGSLAIRDGNSMNSIGVLMIEDEDVVVTTA